jgi:hypothetical protein
MARPYVSPATRRFGVMVVVLLVAIAARVTYAKYHEWNEARAAAPIHRDLLAIRGAALQVASTSGTWPEESPAGVVPERLVPIVGAVPFIRAGVTYDWDLTYVDSAGTLLPVALVTARHKSPIVRRALQRRLQEEPHFVTDDAVTLLVGGRGALTTAATPPMRQRR